MLLLGPSGVARSVLARPCTGPDRPRSGPWCCPLREPPDPKSDGAPSPESTQVLAAKGACDGASKSDEERLGVLLGFPENGDRDLVLLIASWPQLPEHVRSAISTLVIRLSLDPTVAR
jgi:hypothetical protein